MIEITSQLRSLWEKQAETTSLLDQASAAYGPTEANKMLSSAHQYQQSHPAPEGIPTSFIPDYSPESINRQVEVLPSSHYDYYAPPNLDPGVAGQYSMNDDTVQFMSEYDDLVGNKVKPDDNMGYNWPRFGMPTTRRNHPMANLGVHELTHAATPALRVHNSRFGKLRHPLDFVRSVKAFKADSNKSHDEQTAELSTELSDAKRRYAQFTGNSTIMETPEDQQKFIDWSHSKDNPNAKMQTRRYSKQEADLAAQRLQPTPAKPPAWYNPLGSGTPMGPPITEADRALESRRLQREGQTGYMPAVDSVWSQLDKMTPAQREYILGAIAKGKATRQTMPNPMEPKMANFSRKLAELAEESIVDVPIRCTPGFGCKRYFTEGEQAEIDREKAKILPMLFPTNADPVSSGLSSPLWSGLGKGTLGALLGAAAGAGAGSLTDNNVPLSGLLGGLLGGIGGGLYGVNNKARQNKQIVDLMQDLPVGADRGDVELFSNPQFKQQIARDFQRQLMRQGLK